ncbi:MAG TPA: ABC transporter permease [Pirellulales bacterium]|nr:ABC transporter permease [Pirellulales bacterium]
MSPLTPRPENLTDRDLERLAEAQRVKGVSLGLDAWRRLRKNKIAMLALGFLGLLTLLAVFTPLLPFQPPRRVQTKLKYAPPDPIWQGVFHPTSQLLDEHGQWDEAAANDGFGDRDLDPFSHFLLRTRARIFGPWEFASLCGRDELGHDLLSRLLWGARLSLAVAFVATFVSLIIGVTYGAVSGYLGGWVDNLMMRVVDILYSVPFIYVVLFLISILSQPTWKARLAYYGITRITIFFFVIGAIYWLTMARVVRGQIMSLKNEQFIEAARTIGASKSRIIFRHLVPNVLSVVIVYLTLTIPKVMLFEAFLSFLGLGVEAPDVSWGLLANAGVKVITPIQVYWWLVVFPGLALGLTLLSLNFLGDGLRDALDPRLKNK